MKKKGFTLIELIAVLVILAILALIVTPLVMNIIRKARVSADKRSVDAYGRSIELAIANYLLDEGKFPTDISDLTIEYSGDRVECSTTRLNSDSSVYLAGCTVGGRNVDYSYGTKEDVIYKKGDKVIYNNIEYYVLNVDNSNDSIITLLKSEPLKTDETNRYGGKYNYHVSQSWDKNGYGMVYYYGSDGCYNDPAGPSGPINACINNYTSSHVKHIVDLWAADNTNIDDLVEDYTGYSVRLITYEEYFNHLHEEEEISYTITNDPVVSLKYVVDYDWLYNSNYIYWTMSIYQDSLYYVWQISSNGNLENSIVKHCGTVRPVITIKKSALKN